MANSNDVVVYLTENQVKAIEKLVQVQKAKTPRSADEMAAALFASVLKGRATAASKTARENDEKVYQNAIAMGFQTSESKIDFLNRRSAEFDEILAALEDESGEDAV